MALKSFDSPAFGTRPVSSRNAMSPRFRWPRISPGKSLPHTTMRSTVDQPSSDFNALRAMGSIRLDVGFLDDLRPAPDFALQELREMLRRARHHIDACLAEALLHLRRVEDAHHVRIQPLDDLARRAGDGQHAEPDADVVAGHPGFIDRRNLGRLAGTRLRRHGE